MSAALIAHLASTTVGVLYVLMAVTVWFVLRSARQSPPVLLWSLGAGLMGLAITAGGLWNSLPDGLRFGALPLSLVLAILLRVLALRLHMGRPLRLGPALALIALGALTYAISLQSPDLRVRESLSNAVLIVGSAIVGRHAWETGRVMGSRHANWVAWTEWLLSAALIVRAFAIPLNFPAAGPASITWDYLLAMAAAALAALYGNLGYLGMVLDDSQAAELKARGARVAETASREAAEQTAQELQQLLEQRDLLADERERLLQLLAHEIRQPLQNASAAMQGAATVLSNPGAESAAEANDRLQSAQTVLGEVRSVLDNTLAAATLLSRREPLVLQDVALDFLVDLTLGDLGAAQRERITLQWDTDLRSLEVEPGMVRLALRNLLNNAFQHGGPEVWVMLRIHESVADNTLRLSVIDDGPGHPQGSVPGETADHSAPMQRRRLGLFVVGQVMELHEGALALSMRPTRGVIAELVFPLPADDPRDEPPLSRPNVLDPQPAVNSAGAPAEKHSQRHEPPLAPQPALTDRREAA